MFRSIWNWIVASWRTKRLSARVSYLEDKITTLHAASLIRTRELQDQKERFDELRQQMDLEMINAARSLDSAAKEIRKLDEALDATREELRTAKEITIPGLVASNQVFVERWQAETAIQAARAAFSAPTRDAE